jgi:hypothetical protein
MAKSIISQVRRRTERTMEDRKAKQTAADQNFRNAAARTKRKPEKTYCSKPYNFNNKKARKPCLI